MKKTVIPVLSLLFASGHAFATDQKGVSVGSPGVINFVGKKEVNGIPLQFSVGYGGNIYGIEGGYQFYRNESSALRSVQVIAGTTRGDDVFIFSDESADDGDIKWNYIGLSATLQFGGFFIEPGISAGSGDFSNPQTTVQLGWLW